MLNDPIVEEVRAVREQLAARFNFDIRKIVEDAQTRQATSKSRIVSFQRRHCSRVVMFQEPLPMTGLLAIELARFNNDEHIEARVAAVPSSDCGALRSALRYLYKDDGPVNLPRDRLLTAERYLEAAERLLVRWLSTRSNGNLRSSYGTASLVAARTSRYRCEVCAFADVRVLNLDHVNGRVTGTPFACLCANCHAIKSRESDWTGEKPQREIPEEPFGI